MVFIIPTPMMVIVANPLGDCPSQGRRPKVAISPAVKSRNHFASRGTPPLFSFLPSTPSPSDFLPFDFSFSALPPPLDACGYRGGGAQEEECPQRTLSHVTTLCRRSLHPPLVGIPSSYLDKGWQRSSTAKTGVTGAVVTQRPHAS
jgi:hypothetical protein